MVLTKSIVLSSSVTGSATDDVIGTFTAPSEASRHIVEIRTFMTAVGTAHIDRQEEKILNFEYNIEAKVLEPHVVDVMLPPGSKLTLYGSDTSTSANLMVFEILFEEEVVA